MRIFNAVLRAYLKQQLTDIDTYRESPIPLQAKVFKNLIFNGAKTEFGKKYNFSSIKTPEDLSKLVPLHTYNDLKPYIDRMILGEQNILWNSHINWFSKSSGTTSDRSKYIPVSRESLKKCHYRGGLNVLSAYCSMFPDTNLFTGKGLILGGSRRPAEQNSKAMYGDLSAILIENFPRWAEFLRTPNRKIALMDEWESKLEIMSDFTINQNITSLSGVPSWMLLLLKRILEKSGKNNIKEVWPNLEVFIHGGVNFAPYAEQYDEIIPKGSVFYMETYNASEGFFAFQDQKDSRDMLIMPDTGIFFEFVPIENINDQFPPSYTLENVKTNTNYAIVISTDAGLWRYIIGDTVQFTSVTPFRIRITGRTTSFINAFGEEVIIENAERAIAEACKQTNAKITEYTAGPVYFSENTKAAHEWIIEFETEPNNIDVFNRILDETLKKVNSDYDAKRYHDLLLQKPIIHSVKKDTFMAWLKSKNKLGGQNKVPRLSNNRKILNELLEVINEKSNY